MSTRPCDIPSHQRQVQNKSFKMYAARQKVVSFHLSCSVQLSPCSSPPFPSPPPPYSSSLLAALQSSRGKRHAATPSALTSQPSKQFIAGTRKNNGGYRTRNNETEQNKNPYNIKNFLLFFSSVFLPQNFHALQNHQIISINPIPLSDAHGQARAHTSKIKIGKPRFFLGYLSRHHRQDHTLHFNVPANITSCGGHC